jgi:Cutinase
VRSALLAFLFSVLVVACALLAVAFAGSARGQTPVSCPDVELVLVHGTNEGTTDAVTVDSKTLNAVVGGFDGALGTDVAPSVVRYALPYRRLTLNTAQEILDAREQYVTDIHVGVELLAQHIRECPFVSRLIAGYSEGAWLIDQFAVDHPDLLDFNVKGIVQLGDPQWTDSAGDQGIARVMGLGADPYPNPTLMGSGRLVSVCLPSDPVCGGGVGADTNGQILALAACGLYPGGCVHIDGYADSGVAAAMGDWLARQMFALPSPPPFYCITGAGQPLWNPGPPGCAR